MVHDRRIKKQERLINQYQLQKIEEESVENRKAKIRANLIKGDKGKRIVKIYNGGKAVARDINLSLAEESLLISSNPFPFEMLHPQDGTELIIHLVMGTPRKIKLTLSWKDDFQESNVHEQIVTL